MSRIPAAMKHEKLTRDELAARFGVTVRTITNWVADGMPQRKRSGSPVYAWAECYEWREQQIRQDARADREAGGKSDNKTMMAEYRLRALRAEAESAELDLAERRGELVTLDFMRSEFLRITDAVRAQLLSIPSSWEASLATCETVVDRQMALQELVNQLLPVLGEVVDDDGEDRDDIADAADDLDASVDQSPPSAAGDVADDDDRDDDEEVA